MDASLSAAQMAPVVAGGWRPYACFAVLVPLVLAMVGGAAVATLREGYPASQAAADTLRAALFRILHWVVLVNGPRGVVAFAPFVLLFKIPRPAAARMCAITAGLWACFYVLVHWSTPGDSSTAAVATLGVGWALTVPLNVLPLVLVAGYPKRGPVAQDAPALRTVLGMLAGVVLLGAVLAATEGRATVFLLLVFAVLLAIAIMRDHDVCLSRYYALCVAWYSTTLPLVTGIIVTSLESNLDQTDPLGSFATAAALLISLGIAVRIQRALARRGLPVQNRAVVLFPLQVFEDVFLKLFFASVRVFSGGYFVLLAVQSLRTLLRDTGIGVEAARVAGNAWRRRHGCDPVARGDMAVAEWVRVWLQNLISELSATSLFAGAIAGEALLGDEIGALSGLRADDRLALLGGYAFVFSVDGAVHGLCFLWLRRATASVNAPDNTLSIAHEAGQLVTRYGPYLLATCLFCSAASLSYVRFVRIDYERDL